MSLIKRSVGQVFSVRRCHLYSEAENPVVLLMIENRTRGDSFHFNSLEIELICVDEGRVEAPVLYVSCLL